MGASGFWAAASFLLRYPHCIMNLFGEGVRFRVDEGGIRFRVDNGVFVL
jgi:hypothetical protein